MLDSDCQLYYQNSNRNNEADKVARSTMIGVIFIDRVVKARKLGCEKQEQTEKDYVVTDFKSFQCGLNARRFPADILEIIVECPEDH